MRNAEIIIFVVMIVINGGIAVWRKHKQREAARATKASGPDRAGGPAAIDGRQASRRAARTKGSPVTATARTAQRPRPAPPAAALPSAPALPKAAVRDAVAKTAVARIPLASPATQRPAVQGHAPAPTSAQPLVRIDRDALRRAVVLREILGPPRAIAPYVPPGG